MRSNKLFISLAVLAVSASLLVSLYHLAYYHKIYPHVFVAKQEVSNLTLAQAQQAIHDQLPANLPELTLVFGSQSWPLALNDLNLIYQVETSAQDAYLLGRSRGLLGGFKAKWQRWWQPEVLPLKFIFNETKLKTGVGSIAGAVTEPVILPGLERQTDGAIKLIPGKNGRVVDENQLYEQIVLQLANLDFTPIVMPVKIVIAATDNELLVNAQARAETVKTKQLNLVLDKQTITVKNQELLNLIGFEADWNETEIASLAARLASQINHPAQDAVFQFDGNQVSEFKPALDGLILDETTAKTMILAGLEQLVKDAAAEQTITLPIITSAPKITTESVNSLGIKELLGKGESTFFGSIPGRRHNIALAAGRLNGQLVAPGETFSFNQTVGDISSSTGYQAAYIIKNGRTVLGDGGGVCQVSSTLFRAVLNSGLEILERHSHSYRVGYYEQNSAPGFDATVFAPSVDFKFKNDTVNYVLIQTTADLSKSYLKFELYGTNDGRITTTNNIRLWGRVPPPAPLYQDDPTLPAGTVKQVDWSAWGGKAAFDWNVTRNGETLHQKTFYSAYQPWQSVYLRGTGGI